VAGQSRALAIDFGSTFTKVRAVDLDTGRLLGSAQAPSTVDTDIMRGLNTAIATLSSTLEGERFDDWAKVAASSAAGGLRIVAVGLVADLTAEAAKRASLGAGGKVVATFANGLTRSDLEQIAAIAPDVVVLSGGTDGGNSDCIIENARRLSDAQVRCPIIIAGNRNACDEVAELLEAGGCTFEVVDNVLPSVNRLAIESASGAIRRTFMDRIVESKGLSEAETYVGRILMPTPHAVLIACELIAHGTPESRGIGDLVCVDIGGATTDVYSVAEGGPRGPSTSVHGLPESEVKRTVEGDLGLRINAKSIVEAVGERELAKFAAGVNVAETTALLTACTELLPEDEALRGFDLALGRSAIGVAVRRHAGTIEIAYGPHGKFFLQTGKDLRDVRRLLGTGGIFAANVDSGAKDLLASACYDESVPEHLLPEAPELFVDGSYVLFAVGLLQSVAPEAAMRLGLKSLSRVREAAAA
jgi:uncharacterized protein (TIGR01319 family)